VTTFRIGYLLGSLAKDSVNRKLAMALIVKRLYKMSDPTSDPGPPYVGALLRICWQRVRAHLHDAIRANGFTDLQEAHFAAFSYPLPSGVRPSESRTPIADVAAGDQLSCRPDGGAWIR
jgi:hypothetical protein